MAGRISDVSESSQADSQDVLEFEQPIHELLLREQLARQPPGTCLNRQPQLNADPVRLAGRCRGELQAPPLDSVRTVCLINQYFDCRPVPKRQLQLVITADTYTSEEPFEKKIRILPP